MDFDDQVLVLPYKHYWFSVRSIGHYPGLDPEQTKKKEQEDVPSSKDFFPKTKLQPNA